ncbi:SMI1/KNR4 family protein [Actinomycetota bacterium Odt1-20B]
MTDDEVIDAVRDYARTHGLPAPATREAITEAEQVIGFPLPSLLHRLYLDVANGGFGPNEGILGVRGGASQGDWEDLAEIYQHGPDPSGRIPVGLVPVYDWGCAIWSLVDFRDPAGPMWCNDQGELWPQGLNLTEWLSAALTGSLTLDTLLATQPAS